jgi:branched-subunit amino acid ABC-type transport system permease component
MGVINMAHGEFIMAGAYTAYMLQGWAGEQAVLVALPAAFVVAGAMGLLLERVLFRRFYGRPMDTLVVVGCVVAVWWYLNRLAQGRRMRAVMQNRQLAACSGVATDRVDQRTFFIGSGLAGVAGVALTLIGPIGPTLGTNYIVDAFLVVVVGGSASCGAPCSPRSLARDGQRPGCCKSKHTAASTSATPAGACSSPGDSPARHSPTTSTTDAPGCSPPWASR